eukprot:CAMPEP_0182428504 /NCGR_PEP_ID=MMETSP1167-20130531/23069_1 /TAXON_ID=2988 /ORGANISM="Mallomonas Sp, Strain CCMP3275" /LENGTH=142 /DNA_ID=CAMNT_0024611443 /DNA_START=140 /DNA_END=568 /DNA_ORIENTATION=-
MSSAAVDVHPRVTIGKNLILFQHIAAAKDEATLAGLSKTSPDLDLANIPSELSYIKTYLTSATADTVAGYKGDPKAWQNLPFEEFVVVEAGRAETWPFLVGAFVTWILLGIGIPVMLPKEGRKNSKYMQLLERKRGKTEEHH